VEIYLGEPRVERNIDIIQWWKFHEQQLPNLGLRARDYLSVPATSVLSEQAFSVAGDIVTKKRNRLEANSVRLLMLTKAWLGIVDYEKEELGGGGKL